MTEPIAAEPGPPAPAAPMANAATVARAASLFADGRFALFFMAVLAASALASLLLWQKLERIQEELARRSADSTAVSIEARALARQAQDTVREATGRQALLETRLSEVALQRSQLEELMQSLSRSRDENLVVDIESAVRLAQQQAQLTGSVEPLMAALKSAEQRIARAAQPRLTPLARAIARDVDRVKATTLSDTPSLLVKLDELTRLVDDLPLANAVGAINPAEAAPRPAPAASGAKSAQTAEVWWRQWARRVETEAKALLRVSRIDQPEAALLSPEQGFFLRENLKLKLLNARLALLARQTEASRADLAAAAAALGKYFDPASRKTQTAATALQQIQSQMKTVELPRLDNTLTALATAAAGR